MSERTIQKYLLLVENEDVHEYTPLGLERVLHLIEATKDIKEEEHQHPVKYFMSQYKLADIHGQDSSIAEFKLMVDAAIGHHNIAKKIPNVTFDTVKSLVRTKGSVDKKLIDNLEFLKDNGGNIDNYLNGLIVNNGREEDKTNDAIIKLQGFVPLATRMIKTIEAILADPGLVEKLGDGKILELELKIKALKLAKGIN